MSFRYGIGCIVLIIIVIFLAMKSYDALTRPPELMPDKGAARKSEARTENSPSMGSTKPASPVFSFIAGKNIFSPERKDFQTTGPGSAANPAIRPQVILYGITIAGNYQSALLASPGRPLKKGERDSMTLRLGERIGEYKLAKILSDRITLEAQGDSFEVLLYDAKAPKKRETSTPRTFVSTEAAKGMKGSAQEKTSPSQIPTPAMPARDPSQVSASIPTPIPGSTSSPTQIPEPATTPAQVPASMSPTIKSAPMVPTPATLPPDMGGQTVPLSPGMGPGTGQPIPLTSGVPPPPSSPGGR